MTPVHVVQAKAKVALILGRNLENPQTSPQDVLAATEMAVAANEIVESRICGWNGAIADTVADTGSKASFVLDQGLRLSRGLDLRT